MGRIVGLVFKDTEIKDKEVRTNDIDLNKLTLEQLKSLAEGKGIEFSSKIKKDDLIFLIENDIDDEIGNKEEA